MNQKKTDISEREKARREKQSTETQPAASSDRLAWSINEGAHRMGVGRTSVYKLAAEGKLRLIRIAGRSLIPDAEIVRLTNGGTNDACN